MLLREIQPMEIHSGSFPSETHPNIRGAWTQKRGPGFSIPLTSHRLRILLDSLHGNLPDGPRDGRGTAAMGV